MIKILGTLILMWSVYTPIDKTRIIFFGDSITAGYGLTKEVAYPARVQELLSKQGYDVEVVNAGLSGETTAGGLGRIDWILKGRADIFVLELGANDGLRGLPLSQTKSNLQQIIDRVKKKYPQAKIIVAGMMVPPNMGDDYSREFQGIFPELAQRNQADLIPFILEDVAGIGSLNQGDGIHPNADGHWIVAQNVVKALKPYISK